MTRSKQVEHTIDVARRIRALRAVLASYPAEATLAVLLMDHPAQRWAVERVLGVSGLVYGEAHVNPVGAEFLPLDLQRFQLAVYGMENFSPQSTDWLRVTLFSGAPRAADIAAHVDDDWCFIAKPSEVQQ